MSENNQLPNLVSIGITTKNRWQDLAITLNKIIEASLNNLPIVIFDDGSDNSISFDLDNLPFTNLQFQRFDISQGLIVRRNQLARTIKTKYYLSLDDDSYPISGSLEAAISYAESKPDLFCLSFPIYNPVQNKYENNSHKPQPYQVRSFIGCGHLLHRDRFLAFDGYREILVHQGEEMEIAARAFQENLYCYHYPDFLIHHTASNEGRNWWRMDFYGSRNNVLWNDWFVPKRLWIMKQARTLISRLILSFKVKRLGLIQGELAGFQEIDIYKSKRQRMTLKVFRYWQSLPYS